MIDAGLRSGWSVDKEDECELVGSLWRFVGVMIFFRRFQMGSFCDAEAAGAAGGGGAGSSLEFINDRVTMGKGKGARG